MSSSALKEMKDLVGKVILLCSEIYEKSTLEKKGVDPKELAKDESPGAAKMVTYNPCEICGNTRVTQGCHIIRRADGGTAVRDNFLSLCPNHHFLFDHHRLTEDEWDVLKWDDRPDFIKKYAIEYHLPQLRMYWKYNCRNAKGCKCGSIEFEITYSETPAKYIGNTCIKTDMISRIMKCSSCATEYVESIYKGHEFTWWQEWALRNIINK